MFVSGFFACAVSGLAVVFFFCVDVAGFPVCVDRVVADLVECALPPPHAARPMNTAAVAARMVLDMAPSERRGSAPI